MNTSEYWSYDQNQPRTDIKELREEIETLKLELKSKQIECAYITEQLQQRNRDWKKAERLFNQLTKFIDENEPAVILAELIHHKNEVQS